MESRTRYITTVGMFCAIAFAMVTVGRIPVVQFLSYDPKDIAIVIAGFILGPVAAIVISFVVSLIEMMTISDTGFIGFVMNFFSSAVFAGSASIIYHKNKSLKSAVLGLLVGWIGMTVIMLLWNYIITPFYMQVPREVIEGMLLTVFLPFNLIKGGLNFAITLVLYKPVVGALRKANLVPGNTAKVSVNKSILALAFFILISGLLLILIFQGII